MPKENLRGYKPFKGQEHVYTAFSILGHQYAMLQLTEKIKDSDFDIQVNLIGFDETDFRGIINTIHICLAYDISGKIPNTKFWPN